MQYIIVIAIDVAILRTFLCHVHAYKTINILPEVEHNQMTQKVEDGVSKEKLWCLEIPKNKEWYQQHINHALGVGILFWLLLLTVLCYYSVQFGNTGSFKCNIRKRKGLHNTFIWINVRY